MAKFINIREISIEHLTKLLITSKREHAIYIGTTQKKSTFLSILVCFKEHLKESRFTRESKLIVSISEFS